VFLKLTTAKSTLTYCMSNANNKKKLIHPKNVTIYAFQQHTRSLADEPIVVESKSEAEYLLCFVDIDGFQYARSVLQVPSKQLDRHLAAVQLLQQAPQSATKKMTMIRFETSIRL
jgi:hypothetical protein